MPTFTKLSNEEIQNLTNRASKIKSNKRQETRQQYVDYLKQFTPGEYVSVKLLEGEGRITVKNRLLAASKELGWKLKFERTRGNIVFSIQTS